MRIPLVLLFLACCSWTALAGTLEVPEDYSTINAAMRAAVAGDVISVAPGTYHETVIFLADQITLQSRIPHQATIDANGLDEVIQIVALDGTIEGFVITGSAYNDMAIFGQDNNHVVIRNNIITGNHHGIWLSWYCTAEITGNRIFDNVQGGVELYTHSSAVIDNNIFYGQSTAVQAYGGEDMVIVNNTITGHTSIGLDFGMTGGLVANNIITQNGYFGILFGSTTYDPDITQFVSNYLVIHHNDVWANGKADYYGKLGAMWTYIEGPFLPTPGTGEISQDPGFVNQPAKDLHLLYTSPCRNGGDGTLPELPALDMEGDPRLADANPDIGADEFYTHLYFTGFPFPGGMVNFKFVGEPGAPVNALIFSPNVLDPPLPCDYGLWHIGLPMQIMTGLGMVPAGGVFVLSGTVPSLPPGPYAVFLQGAVDFTLTNLCRIDIQ